MGNINNEKDSMEINELISLNEDLSPEFIEQLQKKLIGDAANMSSYDSPIDDASLFEEPSEIAENTDSNSKTPETEKPKEKKQVNMDSFDDNFIKKYKAKLNKQKLEAENGDGNPDASTEQDTVTISDVAFFGINEKPEEINNLTNGNITEKEITKDLKKYNDSLDYLDGNVKYSKYVIYIDPKNVNFIESLTVKERKNLINRILREQDDIAITRHKFHIANTIIKHVIVAILTITVSIPIIYYTINASLEASINNYRRSQTNFQTLYKENGKIKNMR